MLTALFLVWLQMSAQPKTFKVTDARPNDHGSVVSTQIACIKTYADGFIEYNPCEISTEPPTTNFVKPVSSAIKFAEAAQRAADETDGKLPPCKMDDGTPCEYKAVVIPPGASMLPVTWPEPVDVPAVQETREVDSGSNWCNACAGNWCTAMACGPHKEKQAFETCADKSRILEHDENSPPKYWCRKVQP